MPGLVFLVPAGQVRRIVSVQVENTSDKLNSDPEGPIRIANSAGAFQVLNDPEPVLMGGCGAPFTCIVAGSRYSMAIGVQNSQKARAGATVGLEATTVS